MVISFKHTSMITRHQHTRTTSKQPIRGLEAIHVGQASLKVMGHEKRATKVSLIHHRYARRRHDLVHLLGALR